MVKKGCISADKASKTPSTIVIVAQSENEIKASEIKLSVEERKEQFEKYQPTGEFEKDFTELSVILDIPVSVAPRVKVPLPVCETTNSKVKEDKKNPNNNASLQETQKLSETEEGTPLTYVLSESSEYFKARVEIETDNENNKDFIKELYLRGWLADFQIMDIFSVTLPYLDKLTVLDMWNAGLTDETLKSLYNCLKLSSSLKTLSLDGNNSATEQRFDMFIYHADSKLCIQHCFLRSCQLNESGALLIAESLMENTSLLTLNLYNNRLGDVGADHMAKALKMNRTLVALNIGSNRIGDTGVKYLSESLTTFSLTHEQVVTRRMLKSSFYNDDLDSQDPTSPTSTGKKNKGRPSGKKSETPSSKNAKREKSASDTPKSQKGKKSKGSITKSDRNSPTQDDDDDVSNPLLEKAKYVDGDLWIPGNTSLLSLNLSRNQITSGGLELLNSAMMYQADLALDNNREVNGLMRLSLQKNNFSELHPTYISLCEHMKKRDPLYKPPMDDVVEENT